MSKKCISLLSKKADINIINKGLWKHSDELSFCSNGELSRIDANDTVNRISVVALDEVLINKRISFIKMDIEGSEFEALLGTENIIRTQKPKLAISIYHKDEDVWNLPLLLMQFNADYRFYLRHYSLCEYDTVLYAI